MTEGQAPPPPPPPTEPAAQPPPPPPGPGAAAPAQVDYPMRADVTRQEEYSRLLPFVKWLLAIPHYFCLFFLGIGAVVVIFISFFAVLFTREWPRGMFDYLVGVYRWGWRVSAYVNLMTDEYPPFTLDDVPDYPARFTVDYPEGGIDRWRPLVQWILIIPFAIATGFLMLAAAFVTIIVFFAIVFTKHYPEGMYGFVLDANRWLQRSNTYRFWLVGRYPPFEFEGSRGASSV